MGYPTTPQRRNAITKLLLIVVVTSVVSCAPRSNTLRNMAGQMLSPDVYQQNFENFEREDGLFDYSDDQEELPVPFLPSSRTKTPSQETSEPNNKTPQQPSLPTTTPKEPDAAGPALPAPPVSEIPRQPDPPEAPPVHDEQEPSKNDHDSKNKKRPAGPINGNCLKSELPCFPVAGKVWFKDDFGAGRSGHRRHAGNDIFAEKLTPIIAIEDGVVDIVRESGRLSGAYIGINHGNGVRSLYMHLNNDSPGTNDGAGRGIVEGIAKGVSVKKGQHIGWLGNSGNAETTPAHLHFELRVSRDKNAIRMKDFFPTNPFKMLREAEPAKMTLPLAHNY